MNKINNFKNGIKAKDYGVQYFGGETMSEDRQKWLNENPDRIIINSHIILDKGEWHHILEYIK